MPPSDRGDNCVEIATSDNSQSGEEDRKIALKLAGMAERANRHFNTANDKAHELLEFARRCGEELNKAKELVPHGKWDSWLQQNFEGSPRTARNYMRLAANWQSIADLRLESIDDALTAIRRLTSGQRSFEPDAFDKDLQDSTEIAIPPSADDNRESSPEEPPLRELALDAERVQVLPPATRPPKSVSTTATVTALLKKRIKAGPEEAVRDELREIQAFCREELAKLVTPKLLSEEDLPGF